MYCDLVLHYYATELVLVTVTETEPKSRFSAETEMNRNHGFWFRFWSASSKSLFLDGFWLINNPKTCFCLSLKWFLFITRAKIEPKTAIFWPKPNRTVFEISEPYQH